MTFPPLLMHTKRIAAGLSATDVAVAATLTVDHYLRIEMGVVVPTHKDLSAISRKLGHTARDIEELMGVDWRQDPGLVATVNKLVSFVSKLLGSPLTLWKDLERCSGASVDKMRNELKFGTERLVNKQIWCGREDSGPNRLIDNVNRYVDVRSGQIRSILAGHGFSDVEIGAVEECVALINIVLDTSPHDKRLLDAFHCAGVSTDPAELATLLQHWNLLIRIEVVKREPFDADLQQLKRLALTEDQEMCNELLGNLSDPDLLDLAVDVAPPQAWESLVTNRALSAHRLADFVVARCLWISTDQGGRDDIETAARNALGYLLWGKWDGLSERALSAIVDLDRPGWENEKDRAEVLLSNRRNRSAGES